MAWIESYKTQKRDKRYRVVSRDAVGKKHSKSFIRWKDADAYRIDQTRRDQLGHLWRDKPLTFGEFAGITIDDLGRVRLSGDGWFERWRSEVRVATFDRRKDAIKHLCELVPLRLDRIRAGVVEDLVSGVQKEHARQAKVVYETVMMILKNAKLRGQTVPADVFELKAPAYEVKRQRRALSLDDVEKLAQLTDEPHLIRIAALTGLRKGELFALRDQDVDLSAKTITVSGTSYKGQRHDRTKTASGQRVVPLTKQAVQEMKLQMMRRKGAEWVFPAPAGGAQRSSEFDPKFKSWVEKAGLDITFHDLRHTHASLMVQADAHPKVLQELLGHKNFNVTMDLYTHLHQAQKRDAVEALEGLVASAAPSLPHQSGRTQ